MKLFRDYHMTWWEVGLLKIHVMALGLVIGAYYAEYILPYTKLLLIIFVLSAGYFLYQLYSNGFKGK